MKTLPDSAEFATTYDQGAPAVVWTVIPADLETTVSAWMKLGEGRPYGILLESVEGGAVRGRYSVIAVKPDLIWRCYGDQPEINRNFAHAPRDFQPLDEPSLASLRRLIGECRIDLPQGLPPMSAGLFGQMSYDMVRLMERLPEKNQDRLGLPDAVFLRPTLICVFDNVFDRMTLITPVWPKPGVSAAAAYEAACDRLGEALADLERPVAHERRAAPAAEIVPVPNMSRADYHAMVAAAKEYVAAGDIFQVVPSQRFTAEFSLPPFDLYRSLRRLNPSPFLFYLDLDGYQLVGSSPEILVRLRDGTVTIRPIAGTRRRGVDRAEDAALSADLLSDPKELAEHLMLLDLGRNDVGRVAQIGTVRVTEKMVVEYYSHVMHIVSNVEGKIRPDRDALDALIGGFPAGTVSGAPKVRAMEIIEELEPERRGFYGGTVGYFGADGNMDSCIALRTSLLKDGRMYVQAGGGVVADSDPEAEYQESRNKAQALIRAAQDAVALANDRTN
ncbi:MAG TPA: anthranilate synthase component I [Geminicoccus sp.]|uniref:anthranilate synthase component I n=1 Tax=Geminicoccus sp. TaxID=2024832 RepID=UPI002BE6195C|nr:anthranilate synthase component I [Geminicoccus sp.]HWL70996.1 anthranilate synthase component I [Geminicoccus sp.]